MTANSNQPNPNDAVLGGQGFPLNSGVLGGLEGVKQRLTSESEEIRMAALDEALNYGQPGKDVLRQVVQNETGDLQFKAYNLLSEQVFQAETVWKIQRLGRTYSVCLTQEGTNFTGHYVYINNPSTFNGEVVTGRGITLIYFIQETPGNGYYAVHAGRLTQPDRFDGHWYDTAGNVGQFTLSRSE